MCIRDRFVTVKQTPSIDTLDPRDKFLLKLSNSIENVEDDIFRSMDVIVPVPCIIPVNI